MANVLITLASNNGTCTQNGSTPSVIDISASQDTITYQTAVAVSQFQISFPGNCPFTSCPVTSPTGAAVTVQVNPNAVSNNPYMYSSVTLGNLQCNNPQQLGVRVRP